MKKSKEREAERDWKDKPSETSFLQLERMRRREAEVVHVIPISSFFRLLPNCGRTYWRCSSPTKELDKSKEMSCGCETGNCLKNASTIAFFVTFSFGLKFNQSHMRIIEKD
jgi:hypothetical protein